MSTLRSYLKAHCLTQAEFAAKAQMTQGNVAKLCGPEPRLSIDTAIVIEKVTNGGVPVECWPQFAALAKRGAA